MNTKTKSYIIRGCAGIFIIAAIFAFLTVFQLKKIGVPPERLLKDNQLNVENIFVPKLYEKDSFTIDSESDKEIDYIFVRMSDSDNKRKKPIYKLYTPAEKFHSIHELKKNHNELSGSLLEIIKTAYADHSGCPKQLVSCSDTHIDHNGNYHADECWCRL